MKFEFELDDIDVQALGDIFRSQQRHDIMRMLDIERGKFDYINTEDIPSWMRSAINHMQQLDILVHKVSPRFIFSSDSILNGFIARYGENQYDEDGEYTGHTEPTIKDEDNEPA